MVNLGSCQFTVLFVCFCHRGHYYLVQASTMFYIYDPMTNMIKDCIYTCMVPCIDVVLWNIFHTTTGNLIVYAGFLKGKPLQPNPFCNIRGATIKSCNMLW